MKKTPYIIVSLLLVLTIAAKEWIDRRSSGQSPLPPVALHYSYGNWRGSDLALDKDVIEMLKSNQIISRRYRNDKGQIAYVYGAFYFSQGTNRTMHSPLNCYPGSGWEIVDKEEVELHGLKRPDIKIKAQKAVIRKGLDERILYFWYYAGGRNAPDQYLNKALTLHGAIIEGRTDGALITISTGVPPQSMKAEDFEKNFVSMIIDDLADHPVAN